MGVRVFISYSHDGLDHMDRVWRLSERLRRDGVDCRIDQQGEPEEGWPRWCRNQVRECNFVLVASTDIYQQRYEGKEEPGTGRGSKWEGFIIGQELYEAEGKNKRFIPILFSSSDKEFIPIELRAFTHYEVFNDSGYDSLFRRITNQPERVASPINPELRKLSALSPLERKSPSPNPKPTHEVFPEPRVLDAAISITKELNADSRLSAHLCQDIDRLRISTEIRESIHAVMIHPEYPQWMSISGRLVKNPVWDGISTKVRRKLSEKYRVDGPTAPKVMHLDMLLIRRNDGKGQGQIYTYVSPDWKTRLIPFRQWLAEDNPDRRLELNVGHLAKYLPFSADSMEVNPLPSKYAVSAKVHAKYGDLIIYIFEFCSVLFRNPPTQFSSKEESNETDGSWLYLDTLRNDKASWSVNGDVIRALHEFFSVTLGPLPCSLPDGGVQR